MSKIETIRVISGQVNGLTDDTSIHDTRKRWWIRTSVYVDVSNTPLRREIAGMNRHLIEDYAEYADTSA